MRARETSLLLGPLSAVRPHPNPPRDMRSVPYPCLRVLACLFAATSAALAQAPATGSITGRIVNLSTGEYVRNAEVRVEATGVYSISEDGGYYRLANVAPGEVKLTVTYTGYKPAVATVHMAPGANVTNDFQISSLYGPAAPADGGPLALDRFVVSTDREGNAKAIMNQKQSMNITNSVGSELFGEVSAGDVGEFLKNLPGIDVELVSGEVRNLRIRGLGSEYNSVTLDGITLASADANAHLAVNARAFSFEQVSLSSMDSIEVSKTISADSDANAPAGTINLKTKRAFSRAGRLISWQLNTTAFHDQFRLGKTYGPDDNQYHKLLPGGILEFSDVFLNRRLGVVLNLSESNQYSENAIDTNTYSYVDNDPRPIIPTTIRFQHQPRLNRRNTTTLTVDLKATENLVLSLGLIYNYAHLYAIQRAAQFATGARGAVVGTAPLTDFTSSTAGNVTTGGSVVVKLGQTFTALPKFEYKIGRFLIEGRFAGSISRSWYDPLGHRGSIQNVAPLVNGVVFRAVRSTPNSADWAITQLSGGDIADGRNYTNTTVIVNDGRFSRNQTYSGEIIGSTNTNRWRPIAWKAGIKNRLEIRDFQRDVENKRYNYTGPGAGTGVWAANESPYAFDLSDLDTRFVSSSGRNIFVPHMLQIGQRFLENPEQFTQTLTTTNYYNSAIANKRRYEEEISAAFLMGTTRMKNSSFRAGLRFERTATDSLEFNSRTPAEMRRAGFAIAGGLATTIPGLQYQFLSQPRIHRTNDYDNLFPSASYKYSFSRNLDLQLGFSSTIRRPSYNSITGNTIIDDVNLLVNTPNPDLKPEKSRNYAARLAYYFEPVAMVSVDVFQNTVRSLQQTNQLTAAQYGYDGDLDLSGYTFLTTFNSPNEVVVRGFEFAYSQSLAFLPRPFKGLSVRANYTRVYSQVTSVGMSPHGVNLGLSYALARLKLYANTTWRDDTPATIDGTRYRRHRAPVDIGGDFRISRRVSVFFAGRNVTNTPVNTMEKIRANPAVSQAYEVTGSIWTFGIKGTF